MSKNMSTHEQKIVEKLERLLALLEENYKDSSDDYLIAPDQLDVLSVIANMKRGIMPERDDLIKMNIIWKKNQRIKRLGGAEQYQKSFWSEVDELIKTNRKLEAIKIVRHNMTDDKGELLGLSDARKIVEGRKAELES